MHGTGHEFRTVVQAHVVRRAPLAGEAPQDGDDAVGVDAAINIDRQCLASEFIDYVQHLEGAAIGGAVELEVHRPDDVRANR